jgi:F-type H+-transporting ATPase subunit a
VNTTLTGRRVWPDSCSFAAVQGWHGAFQTALKLALPVVILICVCLLGDAGFAAAVEAETGSSQKAATSSQTAAALQNDVQHTGGHEKGGHGLTQSPVPITTLFGLPLTNSMVVTWGVSLVIIIFTQIATRNMSLVPRGAQNFVEWLVESLHDFLEGVIGSHLIERTFWFFATIFIFILFTNWFSLIPGVGTLGWGHHTETGFQVDSPWLRGANADLNMTFSMAIIFFVCWIIWSIQANGVVGFLKELFAPKGDTTGLLKLLMIVVFLAVGCLEVVSILFRPVSLSFRLYGNIFAGENMLETMATLVPGWLGSVLLPIPFYFMELLVGIVQALVFMLLTAVFTMLMTEHEEEGAPGKAAH